MKTSNEQANEEIVIKFKKFRWSARFIVLIILIPIFFGMILDEFAWWAVLAFLFYTPFTIWFETNLFKNFRDNNCPVLPLIINNQGISYVINDCENDIDINMDIKWEEIAEISSVIRRDEGIIFISVGKLIELQMLPGSEYEDDKITIDVSFADYGAKKLVKLMKSYLKNKHIQQEI